MDDRGGVLGTCGPLDLLLPGRGTVGTYGKSGSGRKLPVVVFDQYSDRPGPYQCTVMVGGVLWPACGRVSTPAVSPDPDSPSQLPTCVCFLKLYLFTVFFLYFNLLYFVFLCWLCATWAPWENSASALKGYPRLNKNEINK